MRFVIIGAGAIGGVVGVRLHQAGRDVLFVARGAHHDAIATNGLTLETPQQRVTVTVAVARTADAVSFGEDDVVLLATKSQDTAGGARRARRVVGTSRWRVSCAPVGARRARAPVGRPRYASCAPLRGAYVETTVA